ncbi:MAG: LysM peptidoglycan-binding domain-containing protein [Acidobacteria bacterium]|nr:LysM peptidoglycan-binding domain-containing protein [Acidobacteriota bacterium]
MSTTLNAFEHSGVATCGASTARRTSGIKLTRKGRFLFVGLPLMLVAAVLLLAAGFFGATAKAGVSSNGLVGNGTVQVTVQQGESLWAVASHADSSRDPRDVMADIVELNALTDSVVHPGQQLMVPAASVSR